MKMILAILLIIILAAIFIYLNYASAFRLDLSSFFNFLKPSLAPSSSSSAAPTNTSRPALYYPPIATSSGSMPFHGPTSPPSVKGPPGPPPTSSSF
jgi:hypothetical protein